MVAIVVDVVEVSPEEVTEVRFPSQLFLETKKGSSSSFAVVNTGGGECDRARWIGSDSRAEAATQERGIGWERNANVGNGRSGTATAGHRRGGTTKFGPTGAGVQDRLQDCQEDANADFVRSIRRRTRWRIQLAWRRTRWIRWLQRRTAG